MVNRPLAPPHARVDPSWRQFYSCSMGSTASHNSLDARGQLEAAGCRYTPQRAAIFRYLAEAPRHPTAEDVFQAMRTQLDKISLATVYNTLELLTEKGLIEKLIGTDGSAHFDARRDDHYHLRDEVTGSISDLPAQYDPALLDKLDPKLIARLESEGFKVTGYRLEIIGRYEGDGPMRGEG